MAAGYLDEPGHEYGPCVGECAHVDCAATRRTAESICRCCGEPIGYDRAFYLDPETQNGPVDDRRDVHADCLLLEEDSSREQVT